MIGVCVTERGCLFFVEIRDFTMLSTLSCNIPGSQHPSCR